MNIIQFYYIINRRIFNNISYLNYTKIKNIVKFIYFYFKKDIMLILIKKNYIYLNLVNNNFLNIFFYLKNLINLKFYQLLDIIIVDRLEMKIKNKKRFNFIYVLLTTLYNIRIFISGFINLFESLSSLTKIYNSADWLEREAWDMFGIFFNEHINLKRILTDYGFIGFPLRKDFPLSGYIEVRYDEILKSVIIEPLELSQEFRFFKLEIPWKNNNVY